MAMLHESVCVRARALACECITMSNGIKLTATNKAKFSAEFRQPFKRLMAYHTKENTKYNVRKKEKIKPR